MATPEYPPRTVQWEKNCESGGRLAQGGAGETERRRHGSAGVGVRADSQPGGLASSWVSSAFVSFVSCRQTMSCNRARRAGGERLGCAPYDCAFRTMHQVAHRVQLAEEPRDATVAQHSRYTVLVGLCCGVRTKQA